MNSRAGGAARTAITTPEFSSERLGWVGLNWMGASLSGVLENWGLQRSKERFDRRGTRLCLGYTLFLEQEKKKSAGGMSLKCRDPTEPPFKCYLLFYLLYFSQTAAPLSQNCVGIVHLMVDSSFSSVCEQDAEKYVGQE